MTQEKANQIQKDLTEALYAIAEKHGLKLTKNSGNFSEVEINVRIQFISKEENDRRAQFNALCKYYGFEESDFGAKVYQDGREFTLIGFLPKKRTSPCLLEDAFGRQATGPVDLVKTLIGR